MQSVPERFDDGSVIKIDEAQLRGHVDEVVRYSVEETLNAMLRRRAECVNNFETATIRI